MFTGIMKFAGRVIEATPLGSGTRFRIEAPEVHGGLALHDNVLVNGLSLTVVDRNDSEFTVETNAETVAKSTLSDLYGGARVNLEPALRFADRLAGHLIQGHVDCVGSVVVIERTPSAWALTVEFSPAFSRWVVPTGPVALDGITLNVAGTDGNRFTVSIDPNALARSTLACVVLGTRVNIEFDLIGKYVERILKEGTGEEPDLKLREKLKAWRYID